MSFDVCVIGAGPGGYVCAIRAAQKGLKVAIVERNELGGVCLNVGCIPSKTLITAAHHYHIAKHEFEHMGLEIKDLKVNMKKLISWKNEVVTKMSQGVAGLLKANKVEIFQGEAKFKSNTEISIQSKKGSTSLKAKNFVIATGSSPILLPSIPTDEKNILSSTGALNLEELPKTMAVIGGGYIGLELSMFFAKMGTKVTVLEASDQLLSGICDKDITQVLQKSLKNLSVDVHFGAFAQKAQLKGKDVELEYKKGSATEVLKVSKLLTTIGRSPNTKNLGLQAAQVALDDKGFVKVNEARQTTVSNIFAIGDVTTQPLLAHKASFEGLMVADNLGGAKRAYDVKAVPAVIFTDPEVASVGLTETQCKDQKLDVLIGKFPFAANGRAVSLRQTDGFVKIIARKSDHVVLGLHMVGPEVSQMISQGALALEMGARLEDVAATIHPHPTLAETIMEAAEIALGHPVHTAPPRR